ncbi:MAG TPA: hypothetical protein PK668_20600 [Myxococcota bacterium]|nr:hypothetical protein [Myxococcota bacterium]HRY96231.1 hypothetical protein [Myxococcota bacterium]
MTAMYRVFAVVGALAMTVLAAGCGEDGGKVTFKAYLQHFGGDDKVAGIEIRALDNETGTDLGISATTDATGWVTFSEDLPGDAAGLVGFRSVGAVISGSTYVDTYQFNILGTALEEKLWVVDETTYLGAPMMAGITKQDGTFGLDPDTAVLAGGIYFVEANGTENHIGCATARTDPESGQVRYFGDNGMPTTLDSRDTTNPIIAYYLVANITPGRVTARAYVDGTEIGSTGLHVYANAVSISNIYAETATDPEPAACE